MIGAAGFIELIGGAIADPRPVPTAVAFILGGEMAFAYSIGRFRRDSPTAQRRHAGGAVLLHLCICRRRLRGLGASMLQ